MGESDRLLREAVEWFERYRPNWGPGTLPTWYVDAETYLRKYRRHPDDAQNAVRVAREAVGE